MKNGYIEISRHNGIVLAKHPSATKYATWRIDDQDRTTSGEYFLDIIPAMASFSARSGKGSAEF